MKNLLTFKSDFMKLSKEFFSFINDDVVDSDDAEGDDDILGIDM